MTVKWISHRGESFDAPENTLPAYALSLERNSDGMECDIHFTADRKVVCSHDASTKRVGDIEKIIEESTFEELQKVDVSNGKNGYSGTRVPLFADSLKYIGKNREYYVEIKAGLVELAPEVIKITDENNIPKERIVMICFSDEVVKAYKDAAPDRKALLLVGGEPLPDADEVIRRMQACGADGVDICAKDSIDEEYVRRVKDAGFYFAVWCIDDPERAERFIKLGVDSITSNRAAWLKGIFSDSNK